MYIRAADLIETQVRYEERLQALFDACIDGREEMRKATKAQTLVILARYSAATIAEINRRCMTAGIDACKTCPLSVDEDMPVDYTCTDALGAAASDTIDHLLERLGEARRAEG
jgi:hypothetical protein